MAFVSAAALSAKGRLAASCAAWRGGEHCRQVVGDPCEQRSDARDEEPRCPHHARAGNQRVERGVREPSSPLLDRELAGGAIRCLGLERRLLEQAKAKLDAIIGGQRLAH